MTLSTSHEIAPVSVEQIFRFYFYIKRGWGGSGELKQQISGGQRNP